MNPALASRGGLGGAGESMPHAAPVSPRLARNNFDLLRLLFAGMVALVHVSDLSGEPSLNWVSRVVSSDLAVKAFFVVSGFLIVMSYERSSSVWTYAEKRFRRIYPAYAVVIVLAAGLLAAVSTRSPAAYFLSGEWVGYLAANLAFLNFLQPTLPGVFEANRVPTVNGALWTLKIEVAFYALVPVLVSLCRRAGWRLVLGGVYVASVAYTAILWSLALASGSDLYVALARQLPGQLAYFAAGAACFYLLPTLERRVVELTVAAAIVLALDQAIGLPWVEPAALGIVVVAAGLFGCAGNAGRYGDVSYGVYILHFPILQVLLQSGAFRGRPLGLLTATAVLTTVAAAVLWHTVEKRWLLRSSHYRAAAA